MTSVTSHSGPGTGDSMPHTGDHDSMPHNRDQVTTSDSIPGTGDQEGSWTLDQVSSDTLATTEYPDTISSAR